MKILYTEFSYPIEHYFSTVESNEFIFDILLPFIISSVAAVVLFTKQGTIVPSDASEFFKTVITLLSILVGFTISNITILAATSDKLTILSTKKIKNKQVNLYQLMNINFIFVLFSEVATLIINLISVLLISYSIGFFEDNINWIIIIDIFLLSHIFLLNIRNITNFYFVLFDFNKNKSSN